ncbi:hypothetical protein OPV22_012968 [Ensete ventricosum]|uniref:Uncharacterized protein n=1 Tax=Ensete ventricosum TaxID=4639 RepID=A0AAV8R879_ENSVE|nr:hypothetical protein OPV22_012968 [Ensete ventricosum]RWW53970.1 hypothetical protein BHE74_00039487 [Ensete ventricosum]RZS20778.1 hypothetical protein BHM03_00053336 [Ensete ventricosum]
MALAEIRKGTNLREGRIQRRDFSTKKGIFGSGKLKRRRVRAKQTPKGLVDQVIHSWQHPVAAPLARVLKGSPSEKETVTGDREKHHLRGEKRRRNPSFPAINLVALPIARMVPMRYALLVLCLLLSALHRRFFRKGDGEGDVMAKSEPSDGG